ncbi:hypothetical protein RSOL_475640 [Rhizoctonia solani AG-3 Rhs1AP]|uniref:Uncharacterized protein n=1 Tax=Rhizoctonia solani AG-3 Rhs1AP TaxID=1086054 RepID=X8JR63_9AGAM|nr:hypothetical protein RSOL_475640 [Rhizoctonia solani AG-3 Rhs1AP]
MDGSPLSSTSDTHVARPNLP